MVVKTEQHQLYLYWSSIAILHESRRKAVFRVSSCFTLMQFKKLQHTTFI